MQKEISIVWFRQDLRISDNPTLAAAAARGHVLPIYIFDDCAPEPFKMGARSKIWLHHSLTTLNTSLSGTLNLYSGPSNEIIELLIKRYDVKNVFWNTCYEPWHLDQENAVKEVCNQTSTSSESFNSSYVWSPQQVMKDDGKPYKVFTAYKNKVQRVARRVTVDTPKNIHFIKDSINKTHLVDLNLLPKQQPDRNAEKAWDVGEISAHHKLRFFIKNNLNGYDEGRNYPGKGKVSKLSPHLHFGEISPAQVVEAITSSGHVYAQGNDRESFLNEILWREFSCYLLWHFKDSYKENFKNKFNTFSWENNLNFLQAWQEGKTGYPFIDAGMRELAQTGFMHNRVRMVVASFLVKNLNIHWSKGTEWFWERLADADLANNSVNWQWVAGSGVDAAPYFRIFNPITQGEKFDREGDYTRRFVPELKNMPNKYLFKPWAASGSVLRSAGVVLGVTYPKPIVDFASSRKKALEQYKAV